MRNLKKFFALVLAMLMIVSATAIVSADFADVAADNIYAKAINDLAAKEITVGGDNGFNPDGMVTRWQMALFVARAMTGEVDNSVWANGINIFDDVNDGHYKGAISHAFLNNVILGVGDNKFNPDGNITYGAALKMAVCALGYEVKYDATNWALQFYGKAQELGLTAGVAVYDLEKELTRAETAQIIYNMIYAAPAAKDAQTFAAANFGGIIGVAEDTLFVITATPKQAFGPVATTTAHFATSTLVDANKYVGIQALKNGAPAGDVEYVLAADLGITGDVEDYLNRSVVLTNYKAGGKFDTATIGKAPVAVLSAALEWKSATRTYNYGGTAYSLVAELTNSTAKNELVLLTGGASAGTGSVDLTFDEETGNVLDPETLAVYATYKATKPNGDKVYILVSDGTTVKTYDELLEVPGLATTTGEEVDDVYAAASSVPANSVIYLFDDYGDERYERAIAEDAYISSYYTEEHDVTRSGTQIKDAECDMLVTELEGLSGDYVKVDEVTYSDDSVKVPGTVFTFTYNADLNEVTVLDVADVTTAKLTSVSTKKVGSTVYNMVTLGGKTYYNTAVSSTFAGANLVERANLDTSLDAFAAGEYFGANAGQTYTSSTMNKNYTFYSIGDKLLYIAPVEEASAAYEFIVYKEFNNIGVADVLVDVYANGKLVEAASIYGVEGGLVTGYASDVVVADLAEKIIQFTAFAEAINDNIAYGTVYAATTVDGDYYLEKEITASLSSTDLTALGLIKVTGTIAFDGKNSTAAKETRLRTNSSTVFYFIDTDAADADKVKVYVGAAADGNSIASDGAVYVDKLGVGTAPTNGIAKTVIVMGDNLTVTGFGFGSSSTVTATDKIVTTVASNVALYEYKLASDFGLNVNNASTTYYYATTVINAADASSLVVYSVDELAADSVYVVDANGVVKSEESANIALDAAYHTMVEYEIDDVTAADFYTDDETGYLVLECGAVTIDADQKITGFKVIDNGTDKILEGKDAIDAIVAGDNMYVVAAVKDAIDDAKAIDGGILVCIVD